MTELKIADLLSAEEYDKKRDGLLSIANSDKETRTIEIGKNVSLLFENKATVQSKLQEVLRSANVTVNEEVQEKLSAFNLLLPNINNLKATMIIHCAKEGNLSVVIEDKDGIEKKAWIQIGENDRVFGNSNSNIESSVIEDHQIAFVLEFNLSNLMIKDLQAGMTLYAGIDHPKYNIRTKEILKKTTTSLAKDFSLI
jgi:hypothetical protein